MANKGDELILAPLPAETSPNYFNMLVENCIRAFRLTLNDSVSLDANGVLGKLRVMVLEDDRYKRETKKIRAQRTIDDLSELNRLRREVEFDEDDEDDEPLGEFDIRNADAGAKVKKPKKLFDKAQLDTKLKLFQMQRDILQEKSASEESEGDALNIFFVPITAEEFEKMKTVELSAGTLESSSAFDVDKDEEVKKRLKQKETDENKVQDMGSLAHYETIDGEQVLVEG